MTRALTADCQRTDAGGGVAQAAGVDADDADDDDKWARAIDDF